MSQLSRPAARPASLLALCSALLLAVMLALPAPAQAHDTLLSTDPEDGATLETSPEDITFTFSADILEVSPLVRITDEDGTELAEAKLKAVLTNDPGMGVIRHVDAGYSRAYEVAKERGVRIPMEFTARD